MYNLIRMKNREPIKTFFTSTLLVIMTIENENLRRMKILTKTTTTILLVASIVLFSGNINSVSGKGRFSFELLPGGAYVFPSTLYIHQKGYNDLKFTARYRTESFILPIYYSYRAAYRFNEKSSVELELNHLKLILDNNPPEVEEFSVTHGFNQLWVNYTIQSKWVLFRAGLGPVIAHPETEIRGMHFDTSQGFLNMGYYIAGITSQLAVQKKIYIGNYFFFSAEAKLNVAYANVNVVDGYARVPVFAAHGMIGIGIRL